MVRICVHLALSARLSFGEALFVCSSMFKGTISAYISSYLFVLFHSHFVIGLFTVSHYQTTWTQGNATTLTNGGVNL